MNESLVLLLAVAVTLALPVACIVFPSLLPHARFNAEGHRYFVDVQAFKAGAALGVVLCLASAVKQGDMQPGVIAMAVALGLVLGAVIGLWAHLVWRRSQHRRPALPLAR